MEHLGRVLVTVEQHYRRGADDYVYASGASTYALWTSYLEVFDEVLVLARMATMDHKCASEARADGPRVSFHALPDYSGPWPYLRSLRKLTSLAREAVEKCDAYILRVPGLVARLAWREIQKLKRPYALEVLADPWDALGPRSVRTPFRSVLRHVAARELRNMCQGAMAVHYVTRECLQRRYPPGKGAYAIGSSDAISDVPPISASVLEERFGRMQGIYSGERPVRLGFAGSLAQLYKGLDVLLHAVSLCRSWGVKAEILIAGEGRYLPAMKSLACRLGLEDRTKFLGQLPFGKAIFDFLDSIDLFVMPSRAEGLPRALLEAMVRGCPCIGTNVGGISEVLVSEDMVPAGDRVALAKKIAEVTENQSLLRQMAQRNLVKAKEFSPEPLVHARREFCRFVRLRSIPA